MKILRLFMLLACMIGFSNVAVAADAAPADTTAATAQTETVADTGAAGQGAKAGGDEEPECD